MAGPGSEHAGIRYFRGQAESLKGGATAQWASRKMRQMMRFSHDMPPGDVDEQMFW